MRNKFHKYLLLLLPLLTIATAVQAQTGEAETTQASGQMGDLFAYTLLALGVIIILATISTLYRLLNTMVKVEQLRIYREQGLTEVLEEAKKPKPSWFQKQYARWTAAVPVEKEDDIMFDHEFDGIRELDNNLPPWWVAMFYITIAFAVVYMGYYHFTGAGPSSQERYEQEMEEAEEAVAAFVALQGERVDETNVTLLSDAGALTAGKAIYSSYCVACHGTQGEGGIGPNMTDAYWLHGGSISDVFKTVKYGVEEKGMQSWKKQLSAGEMQKVSSYILSLQGTNPPNAKEPQGELYQASDESGAEEESDAMGMNDEETNESTATDETNTEEE
jgi:cytochrome c oxidase cbb3-type subunit 3